MSHRVGKSVSPLRGSCLVAFLLCAVVGFCALAAFGDANVADTQLAQAWSAFYAGKYPDAQKLTAPLRKSPKEAHRVEAAYLQARILWAGGEKTRSKALKAWAVLKRASSLNSLQERMKISQALQMSALNDESKDRQAIVILEGVLQRGYPDTSTTEAAIELARLYVKVKNFAKAKQALDFGIAHLNSDKVRAELPSVLAEPFLNEAQAAIKRLDYEEDPCRMTFEQAEKLRAEKKFIPAYKAYRQILKEYGQTVYGPLCELHIGHCLLGLNKFDRAVKHWSQFVQSSPSGPWRGQAYLELIDLYLEKKFDIDAAVKYGQLASGAMPAALKDTYAAPSWQEVALLIHLRLGVIACMQGQLPVAVNEFDQALQSPGMSDSANQGLKRLIDTLKSGKPLLPEDVAITSSGDAMHSAPTNPAPTSPASHGGVDKHSAVLGAVMVYDLTGRTGEAETMLARLLPSNLTAKDRASIKPFPGSLPSQLAFAAYLRGKILSEQNRFVEALKLLQASLKGYRQANWHDATLYLLATTIERQAQADFDQKLQAATTKAQQDITQKWKKQLALDAAKKNEQDKLTGKLPEKVKANNIISDPTTEAEFCEWNLTPDLRSEYRRALRTAEDNGRKAYTKSCATALPYWQQLTKYFPKSPYAEVALYNQAVLLYEAEKFEDASKVLDHLVKTYPTSPFAGDACVKLTDIALERMFDITLARKAADVGVAWAERYKVKVETTAEGTIKEDTVQAASDVLRATLPHVPLWSDVIEVEACNFLDNVYNIYLRAAIIAYLEERTEDAIKLLDTAGPARLKDGMEGKFDFQRVGLHILRNSCNRKQVAWYPDAIGRCESDQQSLALKLADTYMHAQRPKKAMAIYDRVLKGDKVLGRPNAAIRAYCWMQLALVYSQLEINDEEVIDFYKRFYQKDYADLPWAADAIMRLGVILYNRSQDPRQSMNHYKYIYTRYPNHPDAERAMYFYALEAAELGDRTLAEVSCKRFLQKYPKGEWAAHVRRVLENDVPKLSINRKDKRK